MNKNHILLLIAVSLFISSGFSSRPLTNKNRAAFIDPTPTPKPLAQIVRVDLDRNEVFIPCKPNINDNDSRFCGDKENGLVSVNTIVNKTKDIPLIYQYKVSGGRIVGQGEKVFWDLKGIRPGTYQKV